MEEEELIEVEAQMQEEHQINKQRKQEEKAKRRANKVKMYVLLFAV